MQWWLAGHACNIRNPLRYSYIPMSVVTAHRASLLVSTDRPSVTSVTQNQHAPLDHLMSCEPNSTPNRADRNWAWWNGKKGGGGGAGGWAFTSGCGVAPLRASQWLQISRDVVPSPPRLETDSQASLIKRAMEQLPACRSPAACCWRTCRGRSAAGPVVFGRPCQTDHRSSSPHIAGVPRHCSKTQKSERTLSREVTTARATDPS